MPTDPKTEAIKTTVIVQYGIRHANGSVEWANTNGAIYSGRDWYGVGDPNITESERLEKFEAYCKSVAAEFLKVKAPYIKPVLIEREVVTVISGSRDHDWVFARNLNALAEENDKIR